MRTTAISLSLLTLPGLSLAAHLPMSRRHSHGNANVAPLDSRAPEVEGILSNSGAFARMLKPSRRLVKKSKRGMERRQSCDAPGDDDGNFGNSSSIATNSVTSTSTIGDNQLATPTGGNGVVTVDTPTGGIGGDLPTQGSVTVTTTSTPIESITSTTTTAPTESPTSITSTTTTTSSTTTSPSPSPSNNSTGSGGWTLTDTWAGNNFFDNFNFWSYADPTHGTVNYLDSSDAWNSGLISTTSNSATMKVDTTQTVSGGRNSIRIHGNKIWNGGMVLMDATHMPTGCGTWPAWWQLGDNWPYQGEIDILEGVNEFTQNQVSLHTGSGCTMPSNLNNMQQGVLTTGSFNSYDCASYDTANQGCGVRDMTNDNSYGTGFNSAGGGVYAMVWTSAGIQVYFFTRSAIPSDITNDNPDPSNWGTPIANLVSDDCNPFQYFVNHYNVFDTTLCGDWAGADAVWNYAGYAGQDQSCASITGYGTCSDFVLNSGSSFSEAYWTVSYVKYFSQN